MAQGGTELQSLRASLLILTLKTHNDSSEGFLTADFWLVGAAIKQKSGLCASFSQTLDFGKGNKVCFFPTVTSNALQIWKKSPPTSPLSLSPPACLLLSYLSYCPHGWPQEKISCQRSHPRLSQSNYKPGYFFTSAKHIAHWYCMTSSSSHLPPHRKITVESTLMLRCDRLLGAGGETSPKLTS